MSHREPLVFFNAALPKIFIYALSKRQGYRKGEKQSNNFKKLLKRIGRLQSHIVNQRKDYLQKLSTEITNQYDVICIEDLDMRAMANKSFGNGKATNDNGYGMFVAMLGYKLFERGKHLVKVDRWYPSSQLCQCGYKNPVTRDLSVRKIICPVCGRTYDRDFNAAINIRNEGLRLLRQQSAA
jgi:putative transposase